MLVDKPEKKIIIVGGGFGGIRVALDLVKQKLSNTKIVLVSDKPHFEYTPALYRVVTGRSPLEVCIPLREIFPTKGAVSASGTRSSFGGKGNGVEVIKDFIIEVDIKGKKITGKSGSRYSFDFLVLALGSETSYFNIPGLEEFSFGFKSINEALRLKRHLHEAFASCERATPEERVCAAHIVIVGGGASGTELAGELALYTKELAKKHVIDPVLITIDLIETAPRLLPTMPEDVSEKVRLRLHHLGVNIFLNRMMIKEEVEKVFLKDMEMKTKTVIWTAGVRPNHFYGGTEGFQFDKKGRVVVDEYLQAKGLKNIFIIGDAASTPFSGMAQTAIGDGRFVADVIIRKISQKPLFSYKAKKPFTAVPIGWGWAAVLLDGLRVYGRVGWWLRRLGDFRYFLSILPTRKALIAFRSGKKLCESCPACSEELEDD